MIVELWLSNRGLSLKSRTFRLKLSVFLQAFILALRGLKVKITHSCQALHCTFQNLTDFPLKTIAIWLHGQKLLLKVPWNQYLFFEAARNEQNESILLLWRLRLVFFGVCWSEIFRFLIGSRLLVFFSRCLFRSLIFLRVRSLLFGHFFSCSPSFFWCVAELGYFFMPRPLKLLSLWSLNLTKFDQAFFRSS